MSPRKRPSTPAIDAHYISGTHWDREWYRPFQEFRLMFVELVDGLLDLMERDPRFRYFHFDGQTCVLDDYLEVRPEQRARLAQLIRAGRILIGPWFTMPDLFCPGAEALVRNLLLGRRIAAEWGVAAMPVAYTCDMFGHPSQMPQIYQGFGLPDCVLGRGTNEETTPAFFRWQAPDGSAVFCFKLQDAGGYGAFVGARRELEKAPDSPQAEARARDSLRLYIQHELERGNGRTLCLMDALDHMPPASDAPRYLRLIREACPEVAPVHSTLPDFFRAARAGAGEVPVRSGELREPARKRHGYLWLIPNCVSSRVRMKQANDRCQVLLERWAEPWLAFAAVEGTRVPEGFLRSAWRQVLLNHAHDSICGCSIDQVHRDMMHRFDQAELMAEQLRRRAFAGLSAQSRDPASGDHAFSVCLANPLPRPRREALIFDIDFPHDWPTRFHEGFRSQAVNAFTLSDAEGQAIPCQILEVQPQFSERSRLARMGINEGGASGARYRVAATVALPAAGYTTLVVRPAPHPVRCPGSLRTGPVAADNGILAVRIQPNGGLELTDRRSGEAYRDLLTFEDRSEIGDGWFHGQSASDEIVLSAASPAVVSVLHDGPEAVTFRIGLSLSVPRRQDWAGERRSSDRTPLELVSTVTLRRGADVLDVETRLQNTAEDHRLRLLLPTDAAGATTYLAHHPFDLVRRSITLDPQSATWSEPDLAEKPFLGLQAVGHGSRGLAFLSAGGLHEGGVVDDERRTLQVTLLRSYRRTVGTPGEQDGLEPGELRWRYALLPYSGEFPAVEALDRLARLEAGLLARQTGRCASGFPAMGGSLPSTRSFLALDQGALVLSTVKTAEDGDGLVVRLWNPTGKAASDTLRCERPIATAQAVSLSEAAPAPDRVQVRDGALRVRAAPHRVVTLRVRLTT